MSPARIEVAVWFLLYGGLLLMMLGLWSLQSAGPWPRLLIGIGLALAAGGALLIWLRSRLPETESRPEADSDSRKTDP